MGERLFDRTNGYGDAPMDDDDLRACLAPVP
jgi:hypothetical protein